MPETKYEYLFEPSPEKVLDAMLPREIVAELDKVLAPGVIIATNTSSLSVTEISVATTRPETMLGDTAVAVNPKDERYAGMIGETVRLPLMNRPIPLLADPMVDREFGTGAVKITPAHDPNDFEAGRRHNLPKIKVIDEDGKMTADAGRYAGLDRFEARAKVIEKLEALGLLVKTEDYDHAVGHCYRCKTVVEPLVSKQWFVAVKTLAAAAMAMSSVSVVTNSLRLRRA